MRHTSGGLDITDWAADRALSSGGPTRGTAPSPARIPQRAAGEVDVLTIEEVAAYLRLPVSTVYRLAFRGEVPGHKVGRHWRFHRQTLEEWFRRGPERRHAVPSAPDVPAEVAGEAAGQRPPR